MLPAVIRPAIALLPAIQAARESARRMQCGNNLKQIGLGIHNFHDTMRGLPPCYMQDGAGASAFVMIFPFAEQSALYEKMKAHGLLERFDKRWWNDVSSSPQSPGDHYLGEEDRKAFGSVPFMKCPSRRAGVQVTDKDGGGPGLAQWYDLQPGPMGDYAMIAYRDQSLPSGGWWGLSLQSNVPAHNGPFWPPLIEQGNNWTPRDTFAWVSDGLSNQIFIGEKHIPLAKIGRCPVGTSAGGVLNYGDDCSYLAGGDAASVATVRIVYGWSGNRLSPAKNVAVPLCTLDQQGACAAINDGPLIHYGLAERIRAFAIF